MFILNRLANLDKKHKYLFLSGLLGVLVYFFSVLDPAGNDKRLYLALVTLFVSFAGTYITQYPNISFNNILSASLLPSFLIIGTFLSFVYFPNLSDLFKLVGVVVFSFIYYVISLVNNVFLVVEDKAEIIPLYRAALTWNQILLIVVAIPYFAGVFKLPINSVYQNVITAVTSVLFTFYLFWVLKFDTDARKPSKGERYVLIGMVAYLTLLYGVVGSFFPNESFLRAVFVATGLMFSLSYIQANIKNLITRNMITEYLIISGIFFLILIVFSG